MFVTVLVVFYRFLTLFPAKEAGAYPFIFQHFPEPISVISSISEQPVDIRQVAQQHSHADIVTDLLGGNEQVEWTILAITDSTQLGIYAALGFADQVATLPCLNRRFEAARWALRYLRGRTRNSGVCHSPPTLPAVAECLEWAILSRSIGLAQAIAVDGDNPALNTFVIHTGLAKALRKIGLQPRHLLVGQPTQLSHRAS